MLHISLAAETLFHIGPLPVTNSLLMTWLVMAVLALFSKFAVSRLKRKPDTFQTVVELIVGGLYDFFSGLLGKHITSLYPLIASLFLFIITSNWMGLLPGVGTIGIWEESKGHALKIISQVLASQSAVEENTESSEAKPVHTEGVQENEEKIPSDHAQEKESEKKFVPLLRAPTADLNMTLALGIIAFFTIQYYGFKVLGPSYAKKFINIANPINFFVGILEIISDISKIISFAFRLFGNIFAGEVLLAVMAFLLPFFLPIPFYFLEIFVGFIQALVFAMLVSVFVNIAVSHGGEGHESH